MGKEKWPEPLYKGENEDLLFFGVGGWCWCLCLRFPFFFFFCSFLAFTHIHTHTHAVLPDSIVMMTSQATSTFSQRYAKLLSVAVQQVLKSFFFSWIVPTLISDDAMWQHCSRARACARAHPPTPTHEEKEASKRERKQPTTEISCHHSAIISSANKRGGRNLAKTPTSF